MDISKRALELVSQDGIGVAARLCAEFGIARQVANSRLNFPQFFHSAVLVFCLAGCASSGPRLCPSGMQPMQSELIYFGATGPAGQVSEQAWRSFLAETVTPRFPDGLSVWLASGQWRSSAGGINREDSRILNVVHPGGPSRDRWFQEIVSAYKARFRQESVLRVQSPVCAEF